ncbi:MAG TPA: proline--tRNA ligase, partial [Balneolaceae bacterium]|nr:proline--tRNA ligase [Balneolaceae bacterium]
ILVNQWANVGRWEMRTRLFLRTMEFLWQEGHTAHATKDEAIDETRQMLDVYATFAEEWMAMPVLKGMKTASERFAGAVDTYCIEALMQDGKALQAGTSHFLGQNFAKAFDVKFQDKDGEHKLVWATSWGVSTRLIGGLIMTHSDDQGLVLPPKLAPTQVVIVPIYRSDEQREAVLEYADGIFDELKELGVRIKVDDRDNYNPGYKFAEHEAAGIPLRIAVGPRDLENNNVELARRDLKIKNIESREGLGSRVKKLLDDIQDELFEKAKTRRDEMTSEVDSYDEFKNVIKEKAGFVWAHWEGTPETEEKIKDETKATIRLIPLGEGEEGKCMVTGKPSKQKVLFAVSY